MGRLFIPAKVIPDAPADGYTYIRINGEWVRFTGIEQNPDDGKIYLRQGEDWIELDKSDVEDLQIRTNTLEGKVGVLETDIVTKVSSFVKRNVTLVAASWVQETSGVYSGFYKYTITDNDILANDIAVVWSTDTSAISNAFNVAEFFPQNETFNGQLVVRAKNLPESNIVINYQIERGVT
jgi:hypothetical protein